MCFSRSPEVNSSLKIHNINPSTASDSRKGQLWHTTSTCMHPHSSGAWVERWGGPESKYLRFSLFTPQAQSLVVCCCLGPRVYPPPLDYIVTSCSPPLIGGSRSTEYYPPIDVRFLAFLANFGGKKSRPPKHRRYNGDECSTVWNQVTCTFYCGV